MADSLYEAIVSGDLSKSQFRRYCESPDEFITKGTEKVIWQIEFCCSIFQVLSAEKKGGSLIRIINRRNKNISVTLTPQQWKQFSIYLQEFLFTDDELCYVIAGPIVCGVIMRTETKTTYIGHFARMKVNICLGPLQKLNGRYMRIIEEHIRDFEEEVTRYKKEHELLTTSIDQRHVIFRDSKDSI